MSDHATETPTDLLDAFRWRATSSPRARFVITLDGRERTYAEMTRRVEALADAVHAASGGNSGPVGVYLANTPGWVVAMLASWTCGRPMAACGRLLAKPEATRNLELAGALVVVTDQPDDFEGQLPTIAIDEEGLLRNPRPASIGRRRTHPGIGQDDVAAIFFTSGTTGA